MNEAQLIVEDAPKTGEELLKELQDKLDQLEMLMAKHRFILREIYGIIK